MKTIEAEAAQGTEDGDTPVSANASSKRLVKNVLMGYVTTLTTTLVGFFTTPLLIRFLGVEQFGLWTMLLSILGYVGMVEVGDVYDGCQTRGGMSGCQ